MVGVIRRRLEQESLLSEPERRAVEDAAVTIRETKGDTDLVYEGAEPLHCLLLLEGFACTYRTLDDGRRQILALHIPSDFCNLASLQLGWRGDSVSTLTPARVALIPRATVLGWMESSPGLADLLRRMTSADAARSREWVVNLGRRTAYQRTAHLLCEHMLRMRSAGRVTGLACEMPLSQVELADALGLTAVHVNRVLQILRGESLIRLSAGILTVRNLRELKRAAGFDPGYLHNSTTGG